MASGARDPKRVRQKNFTPPKMAGLVFSGAETLGLLGGGAAAVAIHSSVPVDPNAHGWTDWGNSPYHTPSPNADIGEYGTFYPHGHTHPPASDDISDPYGP